MEKETWKTVLLRLDDLLQYMEIHIQSWGEPKELQKDQEDFVLLASTIHLLKRTVGRQQHAGVN